MRKIFNKNLLIQYQILIFKKCNKNFENLFYIYIYNNKNKVILNSLNKTIFSLIILQKILERIQKTNYIFLINIILYL